LGFYLYLTKIHTMKKVLLMAFMGLFMASNAQTVKSKLLKIKYTLPEGWAAEEFGGQKNWDDGGNPNYCNCSGIAFTKQNKEGKMHVVLYPSTPNGLDSAKHDMVGPLKFEMVEKYEKTKARNFSFELRRSNFVDTKTKTKSYNVIRYFTKVEDHYYIIYSWRENMDLLNSKPEKDLFEMINEIEPL
jgi:hypothetical protein